MTEVKEVLDIKELPKPEPEPKPKPEPLPVGDGNVWVVVILDLHRPVTLWKMVKAMGKDPRTEIGVGDHLRHVCGFVHGNPCVAEMADPYVRNILKRWKCTARFIRGSKLSR